MTAAEAQRRAASTDVLKRAAVPRSAAPAQLIVEVSSTDESDDDEAADFLLGEHGASSDENGNVDSSVRNSLASSSTVSGTSREAGLAATEACAGAAAGARQGASPSSRKKDAASGDAQVKAPLPNVDAASSHWRWEGTPAGRPQHGRTPEERSVLKRNEGTFYNAIRMDQEDIVLYVNDCLLLRSDESPAPYIARALRFFADRAARGGEAKLVTVAWYLRPEETRDGRQPEHGQVRC
jgi:hypothetical protein